MGGLTGIFSKIPIPLQINLDVCFVCLKMLHDVKIKDKKKREGEKRSAGLFVSAVDFWRDESCLACLYLTCSHGLECGGPCTQQTIKYRDVRSNINKLTVHRDGTRLPLTSNFVEHSTWHGQHLRLSLFLFPHPKKKSGVRRHLHLIEWGAAVHVIRRGQSRSTTLAYKDDVMWVREYFDTIKFPLICNQNVITPFSY